MESPVERLMEEFEQLTDKLTKMDSFFKTDKYLELPPVEQRLLFLQFSAMTGYHFFLEQRLYLANSAPVSQN